LELIKIYFSFIFILGLLSVVEMIKLFPLLLLTSLLKVLY